MSQEEKGKAFFEELDAIVNRVILYDIGTDGILYDVERAEAGPCECFGLPSGKEYCWDKGVIGGLSQIQIQEYCPLEKRVTPTSGGKLPERIGRFVEASESCKIGGTYDGRTVTNLEDRIRCMSRELTKKGIEI